MVSKRIWGEMHNFIQQKNIKLFKSDIYNAAK